MKSSYAQRKTEALGSIPIKKRRKHGKMMVIKVYCVGDNFTQKLRK